jgi:hypothetical protein
MPFPLCAGVHPFGDGGTRSEHHTHTELRFHEVTTNEFGPIVLGVGTVPGGRERRKLVCLKKRVIGSQVLEEPPHGVGDA